MWRGVAIWFQFQTGAIKSTIRKNWSAIRFSFNSKLVRLKVEDVPPSFPTKRFNSKLVRLKDSGVFVAACAADKFQFQTGAIKSVVRRKRRDTKLFGFNSKLVRLKGQRRRITAPAKERRFNSKLVRLKEVVPQIQRQTCHHVSIPNWCD